LALNLAFARMVTLVWEAGWLLARAIGLRIFPAIAAGLVIAWGGNPAAFDPFIAFNPSSGRWNWLWESFHWQYYDIWRPSRAIGDAVVDEFPAFSAILGDFHAHHLALPWTIGWFALLLSGWRWAGLPLRRARRESRLRLAIWSAAWIALGLGAMLANLWPVPVFAFAALLALAWALRHGWGALLPTLAILAILGALTAVGIHLIRGSEGVSAGGAVAVDAGFWARQPVRGLPPNLRSTLGQLWRMWGLLAAPIGLAGLARIFFPHRRWPLAAWLAGTALIAAVGLKAAWLPGGSAWAWGGVGLWCAALSLGPAPWLPRRALALALAACTVLAGLELFYLRDAFIGAYVRYNTYFKLCYPAWPALAAAGAAAGVSVWRRGPRWWWALPLRLGVLAWLALVFVYAGFALPARVEQARAMDLPPRRPTLDAFDFLQYRQRALRAGLPVAIETGMLRYIRDSLPPEAVVAEAAWIKPRESFVGGYDFHGRVASLAGHPVPIGWGSHERQWRGDEGDRLIFEREQAVDAFYRAPTPEAMRAQARALGIDYALYGVIERERYDINLKLGDQVLETLRKAARLDARAPKDDSLIFLFDFRAADPKMVNP
jgi:uncharacterized membrane protein